MNDLPLNQVLQGDCVEIMQSLPEASIDLIFADPPYNLQLENDLWRPNMTKVQGVDDEWDQFDSFAAYDDFSERWLRAAHRILKDDGCMWVIGSYHNIFRLGRLLQDLGFWILNDVVWIKTNPMPNFRGVRFANAHETLIWVAKSKDARYTFNHHAMKSMNGDLQMRSDWVLPICTGKERLKKNGAKAHATQKPEALLYRVLLSSSHPGDVVLDPFFGTGTTGAVARKLHRKWIGIEREQAYVDLAMERLMAIEPEAYDAGLFDVRDHRRHASRMPFSRLLEMGLLSPGQELYFASNRENPAHVMANGKLRIKDYEGSIHQVGRHLSNGNPCNGWEYWYYRTEDQRLEKIDALRQIARRALQGDSDGEE